MKNNSVNFITSFPKSGNTWMRFIINDLLFNNKNQKLDNSIDINKRIPAINLADIIDNNINLDPYLIDKKIFLKTHCSFDQMKIFPIDKVIILIRNPLDVFVSLFNYYGYDEEQKNNLLNFYCLNHTIPILKKFNYPNWELHLESWINSGKDFCIIEYSNLITDFENQIKKLCKFLDIKIDKNKIKFVKENTSFENLKELEIKERDKKIKGFFFNPSKPKKKNNFMNKGVVGNYKSYLNISQQNKIKSSFKKEFEKYNFLNNTFMT